MPQQDDQMLKDTIIENYRLVVRALHDLEMPLWLEIDLTMPQLKTLLVLTQQEGTSVGQVAEALGVQLPTASHLIERLVQAGFALRREDPADRRRTMVYLSPQGEALVGRLRQGRRDQFQGWLDQMTPQDLTTLSQGLKALAHIVQRQHAVIEALEQSAPS